MRRYRPDTVRLERLILRHVREYINGEPAGKIRIAAAAAYNRNQRCGAKAALNLLVSGF